MISQLTKGQVLLFADKAFLYHPIKTEANGCALQGISTHFTDGQNVGKWPLIITKCHVLHITRIRRVIRHRYNIGGTLLIPVEHHPYLGLELDNKLCWKQQLANVRSKGTRTLNMVTRNFTKGTQSDTRNQIYTSLVRPVLEHGRLVWAPANRFESRISKLCRTKRHDPSTRIGGEPRVLKEALGWLPLQNRRLVN